MKKLLLILFLLCVSFLCLAQKVSLDSIFGFTFSSKPKTIFTIEKHNNKFCLYKRDISNIFNLQILKEYNYPYSRGSYSDNKQLITEYVILTSPSGKYFVVVSKIDYHIKTAGTERILIYEDDSGKIIKDIDVSMKFSFLKEKEKNFYDFVDVLGFSKDDKYLYLITIDGTYQYDIDKNVINKIIDNTFQVLYYNTDEDAFIICAYKTPKENPNDRDLDFSKVYYYVNPGISINSNAPPYHTIYAKIPLNYETYPFKGLYSDFKYDQNYCMTLEIFRKCYDKQTPFEEFPIEYNNQGHPHQGQPYFAYLISLNKSNVLTYDISKRKLLIFVTP